MRTMSLIFGTALVWSGAVIAQPSTPAQGNSWTGLLVAGMCDAPVASVHKTGEADRISDVTSARKTTPENEAATTYEEAAIQADRNSVAPNAASSTTPRGTPTDTKPSTSGWSQAEQVAGQMPDSCRITSTTTTFALRTRDGQVYHFDDAGNAQIRQQVSGHITGAHRKIFRVVVKGNLQGNKITVESLSL